MLDFAAQVATLVAMVRRSTVVLLAMALAGCSIEPNPSPNAYSPPGVPAGTTGFNGGTGAGGTGTTGGSAGGGTTGGSGSPFEDAGSRGAADVSGPSGDVAPAPADAGGPGVDVDPDGSVQDDDTVGDGGGDAASPANPLCAPCIPDCTGAVCGPDGCGGSCGGCTGGAVCYQGMCGSVDVPFCGERQCGSDGLGGICGVCADGFLCGVKGLCEPAAGGCDGIPETGLCMAGVRVACSEGTPSYEFCEFGLCELGVDGVAVCAQPPCLASCFGRTCGDDGCGASCGGCGAGETCLETSGICVPDAGCGDVGPDGACAGLTLLTCADGQVAVEHCLDAGRVCAAGCGGPAACVPLPADVPCPAPMPEAGACAGQHHFACEDGVLRHTACPDVVPGVTTCRRTSATRMGCGY